MFHYKKHLIIVIEIDGKILKLTTHKMNGVGTIAGIMDEFELKH